MTELDILELARSANANEVGMFAQVITINFAMVVAIYYFLHQARLPMKVFAFVAYMIGMLFYFGQTLVESNIKFETLRELKALRNLSPVAAYYVGLNDSWVVVATSILFNAAYWILALGVFFLLFFWRRSPAPGDE